ncbi:sarcosine oxidase subunit beta [Nonomuraea fuscirosea]|uniref:Sarcosine oxidase subunit beta n=1 Tax=Nonomuraea fuscirosea TaxID=1291556 RepID=A0A2T0N5S7_9ACTN|nr:FAD-binding oxidoreductase [Nonomuraea fuscirosea]PRX67733.1 sarcosine oxidase subunit beta [Nonomuraea fuscirosea]
MRTAEVVVIGGGCVGTSTAYHLAAAGCTDVVLLEADALGSGSTGKAAGGIRLQHADALNSLLVRRSLAEFLRFEELTGVPIGFKQVGYLFLLSSAADLDAFRRAVGVQQGLGIPSELVDVAAVREFVPQLATDDLVGATFCPSEGYATPEAVVQGYATAARRLGVRVETGRAVTAVRAEDGRITGVDTDGGPIAAPTVVCAAGVHSAGLARGIGMELPVHGEARAIHYTGRDGGVPGSAPLTVDFASGFYFHREGPGMVFGGRQRELEDLGEPAVRRLPVLAGLPIESSWWGYYDMSPDSNAMIGSGPVDGFHYATGFSGHGFQQSPAVGEHLAQRVLGLPVSLDLSPFSAGRFRAGAVRPEKFVI